MRKQWIIATVVFLPLWPMPDTAYAKKAGPASFYAGSALLEARVFPFKGPTEGLQPQKLDFRYAPRRWQVCIGLPDDLYGNELTALCRPEELIRLVDYAQKLRQRYDLTINSAMITDVPGYTWGIVPVLAQSGVKYFSVGPNRGHRIGYTLSSWGDKPFYWQSPSGKRNILCRAASEGQDYLGEAGSSKRMAEQLSGRKSRQNNGTCRNGGIRNYHFAGSVAGAIRR